MNASQQDEQRWLVLLKAAYQAKEQTEVEFSGHWQTDVMREVRRPGPLNAPGASLQYLNRLVWRFACVACAVVLMLSVYIGYTVGNPFEDITTVFVENPVDFTLVQAFGE